MQADAANLDHYVPMVQVSRDSFLASKKIIMITCCTYINVPINLRTGAGIARW